MQIFILFILSTIGLTNIVVHGKILDLIGLRAFLKKILNSSLFELFECYECSGFWCGMIMGSILISNDPYYVISCGFSGSLCSQFYSEIVYLIRSKTDFLVEDDSDGK